MNTTERKVDVLAALDGIVLNTRFSACDGDQLDEVREAVAELIEQQKRDAVLVDVLVSYLNDNLSEREKGRLGAELMARDLSDHRERRIAALAHVGGGK